MASKLVLVLVVVFVLDLIAFALAVAAEKRRSIASVTSDSTFNYCTYTSKVSTSLGVASFFLLLAAQGVIMAVTKCLCCGKALQRGRYRVWAISFFITSWITFTIAVLCLLAASARNSQRTTTATVLQADPPTCWEVRKGIFGAGAAFVFFTWILTSLFYWSYSKSDDSNYPLQGPDSGIRMGQI